MEPLESPCSSPQELESYLHRHIPLSAAMRVAVVKVTPDGVILRAPLEPNINHRETVFGGSASAVAILAAWSLVHTRLCMERWVSRVVIQRNTMHYERPIGGEFVVQSFLPAPMSWDLFVRTLNRRGKARIAVVCALECAGEIAGRFEGDFIALRSKNPASKRGEDSRQF